MTLILAFQTQQNANQAVGSPQMRPSPRPRPPPNFAGQGTPNANNIQLPLGNGGQVNSNTTGGPPNPTQANLVLRLCAQAGITPQQFQTMSPQQQQAFLSSQANIMRQNARGQGTMNGGTPNPQGASTPGMMARPLAQQSAQGSPAMTGLQPGLNGGPTNAPNPAQAAALAVAAASNPALQARLMQMRAQGQQIPPALQSQLAAAVAAQSAGQAAGQAGLMNHAGQMGGNAVNSMMNSQSPRPPSEGLPGLPNLGMGLGQGAPGTGTPGINGQNPVNQKHYQEINNILSNLPEFLKMKEENRLSESQKQMVCIRGWCNGNADKLISIQLDYIVKMKGPGAYGQLLNQQTANAQGNAQMQAQRQLGQQQQRPQNGVPGQLQESLSLQPNQQQALLRQLQNMQQQQQQQMVQNGGPLDQSQIPATPAQSSLTATPRPMSLSVNGQHGGLQPGGTPNSQATSSPVAMGTPSGPTTAVTAAMAFRKIEEMSDEKRSQFFRNVSSRASPVRRC
jgi:hypothetical protein